MRKKHSMQCRSSLSLPCGRHVSEPRLKVRLARHLHRVLLAPLPRRLLQGRVGQRHNRARGSARRCHSAHAGTWNHGGSMSGRRPRALKARYGFEVWWTSRKYSRELYLQQAGSRSGVAGWLGGTRTQGSVFRASPSSAAGCSMWAPTSAPLIDQHRQWVLVTHTALVRQRSGLVGAHPRRQRRPLLVQELRGQGWAGRAWVSKDAAFAGRHAAMVGCCKPCGGCSRAHVIPVLFLLEGEEYAQHKGTLHGGSGDSGGGGGGRRRRWRQAAAVGGGGRALGRASDRDRLAS